MPVRRVQSDSQKERAKFTAWFAKQKKNADETKYELSFGRGRARQTMEVAVDTTQDDIFDLYGDLCAKYENAKYQVDQVATAVMAKKKKGKSTAKRVHETSNKAIVWASEVSAYNTVVGAYELNSTAARLLLQAGITEDGFNRVAQQQVQCENPAAKLPDFQPQRQVQPQIQVAQPQIQVVQLQANEAQFPTPNIPMHKGDALGEQEQDQQYPVEGDDLNFEEDAQNPQEEENLLMGE